MFLLSSLLLLLLWVDKRGVSAQGTTTIPTSTGNILVPGNIYTVAGSGNGNGYSGDGGPATSALFFFSHLDLYGGNFYIPDS